VGRRSQSTTNWAVCRKSAIDDGGGTGVAMSSPSSPVTELKEGDGTSQFEFVLIFIRGLLQLLPAAAAGEAVSGELTGPR
jgi:hypothetical protein